MELRPASFRGGMASPKLPISKIKSDPTLSISSLSVKAPSTSTHLGLVLPNQEKRDVRNDILNLSSASEPNLAHSSDCSTSVVIKIAPTSGEEVHDAESDVRKRAPLIRFQSRVRIGPGLARHRRNATADSLSIISHDSTSSAPSIYAPLQSGSDTKQSRSLGRRVHKLAAGKKRSRETIERGRKNHSWEYYTGCRDGTTERTPLIGRTLQPTIELQKMVYENNCPDEGSRRLREVDLVFGTWPGRLLNRYWWWWRLEPVLYCYCLDESDTEY